MEAASSHSPTKVVGRRALALIIDGLLIGALDAALFFALASKDTEVLQKLRNYEIEPDTTLYGNVILSDTSYSVYGSKAGLLFLLVFLIWLGYWVVLQGTKGFTLGKLLLGLRLVKDDGNLPAGIPRTLARQLLVIVDAFPYVIPYLTGFIVAMTSDRNQRVGDKVAGTLVVKQAAGQEVAAAPGASGPAPGQAPWTAPPS